MYGKEIIEFELKLIVCLLNSLLPENIFLDAKMVIPTASSRSFLQ